MGTGFGSLRTKKVVVLSLSVLTLATFGCAFAPTLGMLAILRTCQGMTAAGFAPVALAYLTESVLPAGRARAIGAMSTAFLAAGIFGQVFASIIALSLGWRWFFGLCGLIFIGTVSLVLCTMLERPRTGQKTSLWKQYVTLGSLFIKPIFLLYGLAHITLLLVFVALYTGLGRHLETLGVAASGIVWVRLAAFPAMLISLYAGSYAKNTGYFAWRSLDTFYLFLDCWAGYCTHRYLLASSYAASSMLRVLL